MVRAEVDVNRHSAVRRAFTLVELLVVIAIIGILIALLFAERSHRDVAYDQSAGSLVTIALWGRWSTVPSASWPKRST